MKRILAIVIALVLSLGVFAATAFAAEKTAPLVYSFAEEGHTGWNYTNYAVTNDPQGTGVIEWDSERGAAVVKIPEGKSAQAAYMEFGSTAGEFEIDSSKHRVVKLGISAKITDPASTFIGVRVVNIWNVGPIELCRGGDVNETEFTEVTLNLQTKFFGWMQVGKLGPAERAERFSVQTVGNLAAGDYVAINYIAFFKTQDEADAFDYEDWLAGGSGFPEVSEPETSVSEPENSESGTSAPENSEGENSGAGNGNGGGNTVVYIIVAAVVAAVVIAAIVIVKKKKTV